MIPQFGYRTLPYLPDTRESHNTGSARFKQEIRRFVNREKRKKMNRTASTPMTFEVVCRHCLIVGGVSSLIERERCDHHSSVEIFFKAMISISHFEGSK